MSAAVLYCPGCNERFASSGGQAICMQCGLTLSPPVDAPTVDFSDLRDRGTYVGAVPEDQAEQDDLVGRTLAQYEIQAFLGKGGMARVYRGHHLMLHRPCAVKVLNPKLAARNPDYVEMFIAEARAAASLVHPHVVTIHTIARHDALHLIEMEYVVGRSLQRVIEETRNIDLSLATAWMAQTCSALALAHRAGMVHRDIKPANILVTDGNLAKLSDFGLAKRVIAGSRSSGGESLAGTPYFMAPELFHGQHADKASDVYALGVTFFSLLTGRLPFVDGSLPSLANRHANEPVPCVSAIREEIPGNMKTVVERCLAKRPQDRYADATELHRELQAVYGSLRTLASLMDEAMAGIDVVWGGAGDEFSARVSLPEGRFQNVVVELCRGAAIADEIVRVYSVCGPATESFYRRALELNAKLPHGSLAIEDVQGVPHFVMSNAYPRTTCDPEEIRQSLLMIARHADDVERRLTSQDVN